MAVNYKRFIIIEGEGGEREIDYRNDVLLKYVKLFTSRVETLWIMQEVTAKNNAYWYRTFIDTCLDWHHSFISIRIANDDDTECLGI